MMASKKLTVCFTVDEDGDSNPVKEDLVTLSRYDYGQNVGVDRVLDLFKQEEIKTTWFIPGAVVQKFPESSKKVRDAGHEIGHHGFDHVSPNELSYEDEKEQIEKGLAAFDRVLKMRPSGYRAPYLHQTENTYKLLREFGFIYDASGCAQDSPYMAHDLLQIPTKYELIDTTSFLDFSIPGLFPSPVDPEVVGRIWFDEFLGMYESEEDLCYVHVIHPLCIGHFSRLRIYRELIQKIKTFPGVTFSTLSQVAKEF